VPPELLRSAHIPPGTVEETGRLILEQARGLVEHRSIAGSEENPLLLPVLIRLRPLPLRRRRRAQTAAGRGCRCDGPASEDSHLLLLLANLRIAGRGAGAVLGVRACTPAASGAGRAVDAGVRWPCLAAWRLGGLMGPDCHAGPPQSGCAGSDAAHLNGSSTRLTAPVRRPAHAAGGWLAACLVCVQSRAVRVRAGCCSGSARSLIASGLSPAAGCGWLMYLGHIGREARA
jgi:hypothetical protein